MDANFRICGLICLYSTFLSRPVLFSRVKLRAAEWSSFSALFETTTLNGHEKQQAQEERQAAVPCAPLEAFWCRRWSLFGVGLWSLAWP